MSTEEYYGSANPHVLEHIPLQAKVVLEVGCGSGALGQAYKEQNPTCCYIGVELFEPAAEIARRHLDRVVCGDVERLSLDAVLKPGEQPDCLIYGDVLEHLQDPWRVLREHATFLADNGAVVACIPNVQHWKAFIRLFFGDWHYSAHGLLDKTHLRFFDYDSVIKLFTQAGLSIENLFARRFDLPEQERVLKVLLEAADKLGIKNLNDFERKASAMQYVVIASKKK
jgi:2-polyprenyl-3-methyl-5-hydroxy-6-metoxy-1,4-benzoquinol methylase